MLKLMEIIHAIFFVSCVRFTNYGSSCDNFKFILEAPNPQNKWCLTLSSICSVSISLVGQHGARSPHRTDTRHIRLLVSIEQFPIQLSMALGSSWTSQWVSASDKSSVSLWASAIQKCVTSGLDMIHSKFPCEFETEFKFLIWIQSKTMSLLLLSWWSSLTLLPFALMASLVRTHQEITN